MERLRSLLDDLCAPSGLRSRGGVSFIVLFARCLARPSFRTVTASFVALEGPGDAL